MSKNGDEQHLSLETVEWNLKKKKNFPKKYAYQLYTVLNMKCTEGQTFWPHS